MGSFIEEAEKRLEAERQKIRLQKQKEQARQDAAGKAQQAHKDHEKHQNSVLY